MKLAVIGLGKHGSPLAAVQASRGHEVVGVDINPGFVAKLNAGEAPVDEPQLQDLIAAAGPRLRATDDFAAAVLASDLSFVIVPTPTGEGGMFSNRHVLAAIERIGAALRDKPDYHVVNITSTVMPGSSEGEIRLTLERASGRKVGRDVGLCYNPEFIALGSVVRDMLQPDMVLIGESDARAGAALEKVYRTLVGTETPIRRMSLVNAELTKLAVNTFVTTKISYANTLAELCERLPGADVDTVTAALGLDTRIGARYLRGALGYGGPCFPRDNHAFAALSRKLGVGAEIALATDRVNERQTARLAALIKTRVAPGGTVGVLGLAYKPHTGVVEESPGIALASQLIAAGRRVVVYDPQAIPAARALLQDRATFAGSAAECASGCDVLVIATAWPEFATLPAESLARGGDRLPVIDCWRLLAPATYGSLVELVYPGRAETRTEAVEAARTAIAD